MKRRRRAGRKSSRATTANVVVVKVGPAGERPMSGWTGLWLFPGGILIIPAIVWFVKVQGALNRYWEGKASAAAASAAPA